MKQSVAIVADNLAAGGACLAEKFLADAVKCGEFNKIFVLHSGNLQLPNHCLVESSLTRRQSFLLEHLRRRVWVRCLPRNTHIVNFSNFSVGEDVISDMGGRQFVVIHNLFLIDSPKLFAKGPSFRFLFTTFVKKLFFRFSLLLDKHSLLVVQTGWIQELLISKCKVDPNRIVVTPPHTGALSESEPMSEGRPSTFAQPASNPFWIYPAAFQYHKNHYVLIELAAHLKKIGSDLRLVITIDPKSRDAKEFLDLVRLQNLSSIVNIGWQDKATIRRLLEKSSGLLFLSTFESLGLPLIEAIEMHKPIVAFDGIHNRSLLKDYGRSKLVAFDPKTRASTLADKMMGFANLTKPEPAAHIRKQTGTTILDAYYLTPMKHFCSSFFSK